MACLQSRFVTLGAALLLTGCSFASNALFPSLEPNAQAGKGQVERTDVIAGDTYGGPPAMGNTNFEPGSVTPGQSTGTFVGRKVDTYRDELRQLQGTIRQRNSLLQGLRNDTARDSLAYHELVAAINTRLQLGTTPGNPVLVTKWNQATNQLTQINDDVVKMNQLSTQVASDSAMAAYLLDSVRAAFTLQGAVEEDHRQLRILEDETNQTVVLIERLLGELSGDITRQQQYVSNEKGNLNTMAVAIQSGQMYGGSLANRARGTSAQMASLSPGMGMPAGGGAVSAGQRPLVVIRFDRPNVAYEQPLYNAINKALERRPGATFDLVAVAPSSAGAGQAVLGGNAARRNAEQVMRSLNNMGLPADRVRLSSMNSASAVSPEVHVYVR